MKLEDLKESFKKKTSGRYIAMMNYYKSFIEKSKELHHSNNHIFNEIKKNIQLNENDFHFPSFSRALDRMKKKGFFDSVILHDLNKEVEEKKNIELSIFDDPNYKENKIDKKLINIKIPENSDNDTNENNKENLNPFNNAKKNKN